MFRAVMSLPGLQGASLTCIIHMLCRHGFQGFLPKRQEEEKKNKNSNVSGEIILVAAVDGSDGGRGWEAGLYHYVWEGGVRLLLISC